MAYFLRAAPTQKIHVLGPCLSVCLSDSHAQDPLHII